MKNRPQLWELLIGLWGVFVAFVFGGGCYLLMRYGAKFLDFIINGAVK